jgi:hypothetical protein
VLDPRVAARAPHWVRDWQDGVVRFSHAVPSQDCPKWVQVFQNKEAGAGHRLRQWSTSLWVAAAMRPTRVAFAHTSLDVGVGMHGGYPGVDAFLGLRLGEAALDAPGLLSPAGKGVKEFPCSLDHAVDANYAPSATMLGKWERRIGNPSDCNILYTAPMDHWASDHSSGTRLISVWKYAAAAKARAAAGVRLPLVASGGGKQQKPWDPSRVHIGVHMRMNDGLLVPEDALAHIVEAYVLAEVVAADVPTGCTLHVFAESTPEELPTLLGLAGKELGGARGKLEVYFYGEELDFIHTIWSLSQCDFFVGSVSSLSCACLLLLI